MCLRFVLHGETWKSFDWLNFFEKNIKTFEFVINKFDLNLIYNLIKYRRAVKY